MTDKSSEVIPLVGSSPTSGIKEYLEFMEFIQTKYLRVKITRTDSPGIEGHPIAIYEFMKFLGVA